MESNPDYDLKSNPDYDLKPNPDYDLKSNPDHETLAWGHKHKTPRLSGYVCKMNFRKKRKACVLLAH
ncbi:MAG: hypothetical protein B6I19_11290 [Bacteroidetes bacterium 4572_114]|nr:MAG: hypothetical protein B6I19_11290 [Bacteroidetes bacterium 4572_114]